MAAIGNKLTSSTIGVLISVGIGVAIGGILDRLLYQHPTGQKPVLGSGFTVNDLLVFIIGLALTLFGGKIHRYVKYIGLGIFGFELAEEITELGLLTPLEPKGDI